VYTTGFSTKWKLPIIVRARKTAPKFLRIGLMVNRWSIGSVWRCGVAASAVKVLSVSGEDWCGSCNLCMTIIRTEVIEVRRWVCTAKIRIGQTDRRIRVGCGERRKMKNTGFWGSRELSAEQLVSSRRVRVNSK
jgi:hypothetical protein